MIATFKQIRDWRWRVFRCSLDAEPLILNDQGSCYLGQDNRTTAGLFLPILPNLGMFGSLDPTEWVFSVTRHLTARTVQWVNHATWGNAAREVYGHPDHKDVLANLGVEPRVNRLGPFMYVHGGGLFD